MKQVKKIIQFGADWCSHCHRQKEIMEDFNTCEVKFVNADEDNEGLIDKYHIMALPALILVDDEGNELKKFLGVTSVGTLNKAIKKINEGDVEKTPDDVKGVSEDAGDGSSAGD